MNIELGIETEKENSQNEVIKLKLAELEFQLGQNSINRWRKLKFIPKPNQSQQINLVASPPIQNRQLCY